MQRILRAAGLASPRRHRRAKYRARRERRAAAGMLVQLDGSRERWFGAALPFASLQGAIDDATGEVVEAIFREQEDAAGYFTVLGQLLERHGVPLAAYTDKHSIFVGLPRVRESTQEELAGRRQPTQLGRAFAELILASSPQAKGRVERVWLGGPSKTACRAGEDIARRSSRWHGILRAPMGPLHSSPDAAAVNLARR